MKRFFFLLASLAAAGHATAGWSMLQETREGILYIDRDGAAKTASGWTVDSSQDFHQIQLDQGKEYLSARARYELDCAAKKIRRLRAEIYPENMAGGGALDVNEQVQDWQIPEPGSRDGTIWKSLCQ